MTTRRDTQGWMWLEACELMEDAERLHRRFFRLSPGGRSAALWEPPVDIFEDEGEIVVVVAMPGVAADRVEVAHEADSLVVRGTRPLPIAAGRLLVRQLEIPYGAFERRIALPRGPLELGRPELTHGCLVLRLRRVAGERG